MGTMRHVRRAAIWTLGHKSKKPMRVDAYVDGEYCAQILANSIKNCRKSRVWHDPLSRLDLTAATQQPAAATQQQQQHRPLARPVPSAGVAVATDKHRNNVTSRNDNNAHSLRDVTQ